MDKEKIKMGDVAKITWEGDQIILSCLRIWAIDSKGIKEIE